MGPFLKEHNFPPWTSLTHQCWAQASESQLREAGISISDVGPYGFETRTDEENTPVPETNDSSADAEEPKQPEQQSLDVSAQTPQSSAVALTPGSHEDPDNHPTSDKEPVFWLTCVDVLGGNSWFLGCIMPQEKLAPTR